MIDASGEQMISTQGQSVQGLNRVGVETSSLSAGLYQVVIQSHESQIQLALTVTH